MIWKILKNTSWSYCSFIQTGFWFLFLLVIKIVSYFCLLILLTWHFLRVYFFLRVILERGKLGWWWLPSSPTHSIRQIIQSCKKLNSGVDSWTDYTLHPSTHIFLKHHWIPWACLEAKMYANCITWILFPHIQEFDWKLLDR